MVGVFGLASVFTQLMHWLEGEGCESRFTRVTLASSVFIAYFLVFLTAWFAYGIVPAVLAWWCPVAVVAAFWIWKT